MTVTRQHLSAGGGVGASLDNRVGIPMILAVVWMLFEFGRPPRPMGIPMLISLAGFGLWISRSDKKWGQQPAWWFIILALLAIQIPFVSNTFASFRNTRQMAILFLCVCLPMQSAVLSVRGIRVWVYSFLAVSFYVGLWAAFNGGYGPSGALGGQDENYVAAQMCMAIPFAYFCLLSEKRFLLKIALAACIVACLAAIGLANNASRGGFLALICLAVYCLARSQRKMMGVAVLALAGVALAAIAGPAFWAEISTSTDVDSGTADLRIQAWKAGFRMFLSNPVMGIGSGNFAWELGNFETAGQVAELGRSLGGSMMAHSLWVELGSELGIVGFVSTIALCLFAWSSLEHVRKATLPGKGLIESSPQIAELRTYTHALQGSLIAIAVNGLFLSLLYNAHLWLLIALSNAMPYLLKSMTGHGLPIRGGRGGAVRGGPQAGTPNTRRRAPQPHSIRRAPPRTPRSI